MAMIRTVLIAAFAHIIANVCSDKLLAQPVPVTSATLTNSQMVLTFDGHPTNYYILYSGPLDRIQTTRTLALGQAGRNTLATSTEPAADSAFFRIQAVPMNASFDLDDDGISDEYELRNPGILDPLDAMDSLGDPDADGINTQEEFSRGWNPRDATSPTPAETSLIPYASKLLSAKFSVTRRTPSGPGRAAGTHGTGGLVEPLTTLSLNDRGSIAYVGVIKDHPGGPLTNIFVSRILDDDQWETKPILTEANARSIARLGPELIINNRNQVLARFTFQDPTPLGLATTHFFEVYDAGGGGRIATIANNDPLGLSSRYTRLESMVAFNDAGQSAFWVTMKGGERALVARSGGQEYGPFPLANELPFNPISISEVGSLAFLRGNSSGSLRINAMPEAFRNYWKLDAGSASGFRSLGKSPGLSPDGRILVFYADYFGPSNREIHTQGPGIFAAVSEVPINSVASAGKVAIRRLAGVVGNGAFDPGESWNDLNNNSRIDDGEDQGVILAFSPDSRISVNSDGFVIFQAVTPVDTPVGGIGVNAMISVQIRGLNPFRLSPQTVALSTQEITGTGDSFARLALGDSISAGTVPIAACVIQGTDGSSSVEACRLGLVELVVDRNRDGRFHTHADGGLMPPDPATLDTTDLAHPFRIWSNDDDDSGDWTDAPLDDVVVSSGTIEKDTLPGRDFSSVSQEFDARLVDGRRDLLDFFPVVIRFNKVLGGLSPIRDLKFVLKASGENRVNVLPTSLKVSEAYHHLRDSELSKCGPTLEIPANGANLIRLSESGFELPAVLLSLAKVNDGIVLLIEGGLIGRVRLTLETRSGEEMLSESSVECLVSPVESMYRHVDLSGATVEYDGTPARRNQVLPERLGDPGFQNPDNELDTRYVAFIHGYNVNTTAARGWHAEIFKRLYQFGSKARFIGVTWNGDVPEIPAGVDYHRAVFYGLQTGDLLAGRLTFTGGAPLIVVGHSLGNMVVSHAIASGGLQVEKYVMINSAVALEAYDPAARDKVDPANPELGSQSQRMTLSDWRSYGWPANAFAANWYRQFLTNPEDSRRDFKWEGRFDSIVERVYQYYSPGDHVLENPTSPPTSDKVRQFFETRDFARGSWRYQEWGKGSGSMVGFWQRIQAGWRINGDWYKVRIVGGIATRYPPSAEEVSMEGGLDVKPLFSPFRHEQLHSSDWRIASASGQNRLVKYECLATGIPALSFAAASNPIEKLPPSRRFNMESQGRSALADGRGWPETGHDKDWARGRWLHSDLKNCAVQYVAPLFEHLVSLVNR